MARNGRTSKSPPEKNVFEKDNNLSPRRKYKNIFLQVCFAILCAKFCERLTLIGLTSSLTIFFTKVCAKSISIAPRNF